MFGRTADIDQQFEVKETLQAAKDMPRVVMRRTGAMRGNRGGKLIARNQTWADGTQSEQVKTRAQTWAEDGTKSDMCEPSKISCAIDDLPLRAKSDSAIDVRRVGINESELQIQGFQRFVSSPGSVSSVSTCASSNEKQRTYSTPDKIVEFEGFENRQRSWPGFESTKSRSGFESARLFQEQRIPFVGSPYLRFATPQVE